MIDLKKDISEQKYDQVLNALNALNIGNANDEDFSREVSNLLEIFYACYNSSDESANRVAIKCLNLLKRSCARGEMFQNIIIAKEGLLDRVRDILINEEGPLLDNIRTNCLQLVANLSVQNKPNQERIINHLKSFLLENITSNGDYTNASAMILYNAFIYKSTSLNLDGILETILENVAVNQAAQKELPEFVCIFLEYLISESNEVVEVMEKMDFNRKLLLYRYLIEYVRQEDRRVHPIHPDVFKHLLEEFKKKSDMVLKTETIQLNAQDTEEVFTLLIFISDTTCVEPYASFLRHDGGLFLNLGCLLRQMQMIGKADTKNMFTPVQKLDEILRIKKGDSDLDIEGHISYSLRSAVVKALANLAYKSKKNQKMAREMDIIAAILECTNLDARNPLIKEWSILAIHNLCDDNLENQQFIAGLKKQGDAENSLITEYKAGTIRISEGKSGGRPT
uniref:Ataxin-10 n=1 Tax=Anopheles atroparvus TaxID=41427 RepID=A0A182JLG3_ANOAO